MGWGGGNLEFYRRRACLNLLAFDTCQDVQTELHVPPFAAKKIITMRDAALALVNLVSIQSVITNYNKICKILIN